MRKIACIEPKEREALIRNTAAKMGVNEAVVEKDFGYATYLTFSFTDVHGKAISCLKAERACQRHMV